MSEGEEAHCAASLAPNNPRRTERTATGSRQGGERERLGELTVILDWAAITDSFLTGQ